MHYHWPSVFTVLSAVVLVALAAPPAPLWGDVRVKHTWGDVPVNWKSLGPPPAGTTMDLHMELKPQHEDALIDALYEVSDPSHQKYGAHLSREEVAELVAPHQDTLEIVHSWLEHHGVPSSSISTSHGGGWLTITGVSVSQVDELLGASYQLYRHIGSNETGAILRTVGYSLPAVLHEHVQTVAPTTHFASPRRPRQSRLRKEVVNATSGERVGSLSRRAGHHVTPPFLRWLYKTQAYTPPLTIRNALGAVGFQGENPIQEDLTTFMNTLRGDAEGATFNVVPVNNGEFDATNPAVPASVQIQYSQAMAYPTPYIFYSAGGGLQWSFTDYKPAPGDAYLEWLNFLIALPNEVIPPTISITYTDPEPELPRAYARALCTLFSQLGTRGISILAASGDEGVGGPGECKNRYHKTWFIPMFPASCPSVTSVGATTRFGPEVGAFLSGGGFSRHFARAKYQNQNGAVPNYLRSIGNMYSNYYPNAGRGIPDISAQGLRFAYIFHNSIYEVNGTDCSTSTAAGIVSMLNAYRISSGNHPLGFLNPWLYGTGIVGIEDIVSGSNPGCGTPGFSAAPGWDPVTGLGTLNFEKLLPLALAPYLGH